jgi:predicted type IV restriction endonuclease
MFKVGVTIFQQIVTELSGAESEEDRIVAIIKTLEAKWLLQFIGPSKL